MVECEQTQKSPHLHWMALLQIMNSNVCINYILKNDKKIGITPRKIIKSKLPEKISYHYHIKNISSLCQIITMYRAHGNKQETGKRRVR